MTISPSIGTAVSSTAVAMPGRESGSVTWRKVDRREAPRSRLASISGRGMRSSTTKSGTMAIGR